MGPQPQTLLIGLLKKRLLGRREGQKQGSGPVHYGAESVALIERDRLIVLSVNEQSERGRCVAKAPMNGVHQYQFTKAAPLKAMVDGQSPNTNCRQGWIARQTFGFVRREIQQ